MGMMDASSERALITGGSGFVGAELVRQLQGCGVAVRAPVRPAFDLLKPESLQLACRDIDVIYHLAAYAHVNQADQQCMQAVNVNGTCNLLDAAVAAGVKRLVYVSSILADPDYDKPRTAYGVSKFQAEQVLIRAHEQGRIAVTIIRPCSVYGTGMKGNLATLLRFIAKGFMPPLPDFKQSFSLISVQDLCAGLRAANRQLQSSVTATPHVFALSDGEQYSLKALESATRIAAGKAPYRIALPRVCFYTGALLLELAGKLMRVNNAPGLRTYRALARPYCVDDAESRRQLGYNPRITLYQVLPELIAGHA
jgi:UDP-glucose 4-epimerase